MVKHFIPTTLAETLDILANHNVELIAGGTDLMVQRRTWANTTPNFTSTVNICNLSELNYITLVDNELHIGATTPLTDIWIHQDTPELLKQSISIIASPALRNVATIAGNIGNASPAGDTLPILYLYDAKLVLLSKHNKRVVPVQDVILGPRRTIIAQDELIREIILPLHPFTTVRFDKVGGRKADAISKVSFSGAVLLDENRIRDIRFCFGAVGPTMIRNRSIEDTIIGCTIEELQQDIPRILNEYGSLVSPIDDQRSNKQYRKQVALNLLQDFIEQL